MDKRSGLRLKNQPEPAPFAAWNKSAFGHAGHTASQFLNGKRRYPAFFFCGQLVCCSGNNEVRVTR
ncbi:hypothetical protein HMPREF7215_1021 [Pyramidobacter piscolens W5455]|uniref:Uncharacterized protein n=1 Tax=Pyramidobacter piscolens W5455 TaxID=352165 RepID=A0ABM9ZRV0_9BACT|nr:hypothetical protein HMPREF7215_1021 [Pyramidobacter piscolens W5455]